MRQASPAERASFGREARARVPRSSHGDWEPRPGRTDPLDTLALQATTRVSELVPIRYGRMADSAFAYFRGAAAVMAADLAHEKQSGLDVQLCGDAHLFNFGGFASPERDLIFDVKDFDGPSRPSPPTTDHRPPTTDHRPPTTDHRPPTTDHRQPTTDNRQPTTDNRQPTTDNRPPR
jgi:Uncharacterized protein conserved in bacteria (DUF2252)